jgi:hypothetical protein
LARQVLLEHPGLVMAAPAVLHQLLQELNQLQQFLLQADQEAQTMQVRGLPVD